uniref:Uncharacterized protein n=1 Tax=Oryza sativa subsp. japonica TaxID=39947 RepID=Q5W760_ORYSJ|nr:hypothetical protein [Oryza sativa Japonica Group]AAV43887.1 hypothetical protein [Oryza sativa Japonica Group]
MECRLTCPQKIPLTKYSEVASIPLPYAVSSIWPLPSGLLLQKSTDGGHMHSVWQIDGTTYQEEINDNAVPPIPCDISMHKFAFRKIWQGKCSQSAAIDENNGESFGDIKPHMSWNIPALAAAPVVKGAKGGQSATIF